MNYANQQAAVSKVTKHHEYMDVDVILTFDTADKMGDTQEFLNIKLYVHFKDGDAISFLNKRFFPRVAKACLKRNRSPKNLLKISTAANWDIYEQITNHESLISFGNNGKWHFGQGRNDLDVWEKCLMCTYGFGTEVDMHWIGDLHAEEAMLREKIMQLANEYQLSDKS